MWSFVGYSVTEDMTLDANWKAHVYSVTYNLDGGTNSAFNPSSYTIEDSIVLQNPSKADYPFLGWYDDKNNQVTTLGQNVIGDLVLTARWSRKYSVTYILDGGTNDLNNPDYYFQENNIELKNPAKKGHRFVGWYDDKNNRITSLGQTITGDLVLTARWSNYSLVTLTSSNSSLGTVSGGGEYEITSLVTVVATAIGEGTFVCWINTDNESLVSYENNYSFYMSEQDVALTAVFDVFEKIDRIVFSDYDESHWFNHELGSKIDKEINGSELTLTYYEYDPNAPFYSVGWGLELLKINKAFVESDSIRFKIKSPIQHGYLSGLFIIQLYDRDNECWTFNIPLYAIDDQYKEIVLPYEFAKDRPTNEGNKTIDFDYIDSVAFGYENDFGAGLVSIKDFEIIKRDENTPVTIFDEGISFESFKSEVSKHEIGFHSQATISTCGGFYSESDGEYVSFNETFELKINERTITNQDDSIGSIKEYAILDNGTCNRAVFKFIKNAGNLPVDAGAVISACEAKEEVYFDPEFANNPLSFTYILDYNFGDYDDFYNKSNAILLMKVIFDKDMCLNNVCICKKTLNVETGDYDDEIIMILGNIQYI